MYIHTDRPSVPPSPGNPLVDSPSCPSPRTFCFSFFLLTSCCLCLAIIGSFLPTINYRFRATISDIGDSAISCSVSFLFFFYFLFFRPSFLTALPLDISFPPPSPPLSSTLHSPLPSPPPSSSLRVWTDFLPNGCPCLNSSNYGTVPSKHVARMHPTSKMLHTARNSRLLARGPIGPSYISPPR
ncbi:hypothetical protein DFP73DRAFT_66509 [Morchella snyderi]|nr:hypothetical protein DFP73DRAFT_66509 [Morchella snyderi]